MSDFNYQEYLKNNPLLKEEVKEEQLLTEEKKKDVEESAPGYKHDCAAHVMHESHGYGLCLEGRHTLVETTEGHAEVTHYDVMFKNGNIVEKIPVNELKVLTSESHTHSKYEEDDVEMEENIDENRPHPTEVFSDEELDYIGDMLVAMYEKLGLEKSPGETDVVKAGALMDRIEGFFETLNEEKVTEEVTEEEIQEEVPSSKMKVSELKAKIKEDIISLLQEEEEDEVEVEAEIEVDAEEPPMDTADDAGLTTDEQEIQDSLKLAYDNAVAIGDQKLADQIGNSITFFTRTHVVER